MISKALFSSKTEVCSTPQDLFDALNKEFHFTCDVCAIAENAKCERFFSPQDDGLSQKWEGVCWCNPPYGKDIKKWVKKASESDATVVMLLPARTDTIWFHEYIYGKAEIRFIKGRLRFNGMKTSAPFPSMISIFNQKARSGEEAFELDKVSGMTE